MRSPSHQHEMCQTEKPPSTLPVPPFTPVPGKRCLDLRAEIADAPSSVRTRQLNDLAAAAFDPDSCHLIVYFLESDNGFPLGTSGYGIAGARVVYSEPCKRRRGRSRLRTTLGGGSRACGFACNQGDEGGGHIRESRSVVINPSRARADAT